MPILHENAVMTEVLYPISEPPEAIQEGTRAILGLPVGVLTGFLVWAAALIVSGSTLGSTAGDPLQSTLFAWLGADSLGPDWHRVNRRYSREEKH